MNPVQTSLADQLDQLDRLAAQNGLYDAQDWLRARRENRTASVHDMMNRVHDFLVANGPQRTATLRDHWFVVWGADLVGTAIAGLVATSRVTIHNNVVTAC